MRKWRQSKRVGQKTSKKIPSHLGKNVAVTKNPLLTSYAPVWRSRLIVAGMALSFIGLTARAAYVQIINSDAISKEGHTRFMRTLTLPAYRGRILDRNGLILASSVTAYAIWAFPQEIQTQEKIDKLTELTAKQRKELEEKAREQSKKREIMAHLLDMPLKKINERLKRGQNKKFVYLKRQVDAEIAEQIKALGVHGVYQLKEYRRRYPEGAALAQVVGFTDIEGKGIAGIEAALNKQLSGEAGSLRVVKNPKGQVVESVGDALPAKDGQDVRLTIDSRIQYFAWQKLRAAVRAQRAKSGSLVILDARNGDILALANYPSYDPNNRKTIKGDYLRNRALVDTYEPGSTIKPFTVALGLQKKKIRPNTLIATNPGKLTIDGATIGDIKNYGTLSASKVIQKSSNVGVVRIAQHLSRQEMWENFHQLGVGIKPQLHFPRTARGRLRKWKSWRRIEKATMSYGYGLSTSLFQLTNMYTAFANDGKRVSSRLIQDIGHTSGNTYTVEAAVFTPQVAKQMRNMLHAVTQAGGTAQQAQMTGYSTGGKTGTTRKQIGRDYSSSRYRSSFVGIAPIDKPRVVVGVMIDDPKKSIYGGVVAAPVFSEVTQQTLRLLGVAPDISVQAGIVVDPAQESL